MLPILAFSSYSTEDMGFVVGVALFRHYQYESSDPKQRLTPDNGAVSGTMPFTVHFFNSMQEENGIITTTDRSTTLGVGRASINVSTLTLEEAANEFVVLVWNSTDFGDTHSNKYRIDSYSFDHRDCTDASGTSYYRHTPTWSLKHQYLNCYTSTTFAIQNETHADSLEGAELQSSRIDANPLQDQLVALAGLAEVQHAHYTSRQNASFDNDPVTRRTQYHCIMSIEPGRLEDTTTNLFLQRTYRLQNHWVTAVFKGTSISGISIVALKFLYSSFVKSAIFLPSIDVVEPLGATITSYPRASEHCKACSRLHSRMADTLLSRVLTAIRCGYVVPKMMPQLESTSEAAVQGVWMRSCGRPDISGTHFLT